MTQHLFWLPLAVAGAVMLAMLMRKVVRGPRGANSPTVKSLPQDQE
jgi:hypothetical protein